VTVAAVSTPEEVTEAYVVGATLHVGVTPVELPSLHVAVAVYVPVAPSFTDEGPEIDRLDSVAVTLTMATDCVAERFTPPEV